MIAQAVIIWPAIVAGRRWRREQSLSVVRWAAELAVGPDGTDGKRELGVATLLALGKSPLFHTKDQVILDAALAVAVQGDDDGAIEAYDDNSESQAGEEVEHDEAPGQA